MVDTRVVGKAGVRKSRIDLLKCGKCDYYVRLGKNRTGLLVDCDNADGLLDVEKDYCPKETIPTRVIVAFNSYGGLRARDRETLVEDLIRYIAEFSYGYATSRDWSCSNDPNEPIKITIRVGDELKEDK